MSKIKLISILFSVGNANNNQSKHGRRQRGAGGSRGPPLDFQHGTNIVDRGLKVLFFGLFSVPPPPPPPPEEAK